MLIRSLDVKEVMFLKLTPDHYISDGSSPCFVHSQWLPARGRITPVKMYSEKWSEKMIVGIQQARPEEAKWSHEWEASAPHQMLRLSSHSVICFTLITFPVCSLDPCFGEAELAEVTASFSQICQVSRSFACTQDPGLELFMLPLPMTKNALELTDLHFLVCPLTTFEHWRSILFLLVFGAHLAVIRGYLWWAWGTISICQGTNLSQLSVR